MSLYKNNPDPRVKLNMNPNQGHVRSETTQSQVPQLVKSAPTTVQALQQREKLIEAARLKRVAEKKAEMDKYYSQPGMVSGVKNFRPDTQKMAEKSVAYDDIPTSEKVKSMAIDASLALLPEIAMMRYAKFAYATKNLARKPVTSHISLLSKVDDVKPFQSEINWANWNKEIPTNKSLMQEYEAIEQSSKAKGTWMKNPDGSVFNGTPEQFVQQNSENFKKAFGSSKLVNPDGSPTIQYHGSAKKFDTFDESKFQLGDSGYSGRGIYTTPDKHKASSYSLSSKSIHKDGNNESTIYELYGQGNNPISAEELIKQNKGYDLFNFHRAKDWKGDVPIEQQMLDYDVAIRNQTRGVERISPWNEASELVFPTNKQLKSAVGNNGMFDMTNPNIYKSIAALIGTSLMSKPKQ